MLLKLDTYATGGIIQTKQKKTICLWLLTDTKLAMKTSNPTKRIYQKHPASGENNNLGIKMERKSFFL